MEKGKENGSYRDYRVYIGFRGVGFSMREYQGGKRCVQLYRELVISSRTFYFQSFSLPILNGIGCRQDNIFGVGGLSCRVVSDGPI